MSSEVVEDLTEKIQRDFDAELEVTYDHALVVGWQPEQLRVFTGQNRAYLAAMDGNVERYRLCEVWLELKDGISINVRRAKDMPAPLPVPLPKKLMPEQIAEQCDWLVRRKSLGTKITLPEVRPLVDAYYDLPGNGSGGNFHVVLDDCNLERQFIVSAIERSREAGDSAGINLGRVLLELTPSQRRRL